MKRLIVLQFFFFITAITTKVISQSPNLEMPLPIDQTIKKGMLPNGMTYYIKSTKVVKGAASYYIIQNVGSILENDDQQGLAHFLEHMAFNGTESFPGKGILNTLQKHGAVFGKDINAYTSFDETVYNLSNIPTKDGLVDTCLTVLKDWSHYLLLTDKEIDDERGVIKEEWRARQNGSMRLYETSLPITLNNSKYASRLPLGLMSVVENFKYKALRDFYHDWYRTDLQAIAIIGDIDVAEIEEKIKAMFSEIPAVNNPKARYIVDIPENDTMLYSLGMDPEVSTATIEFGIRHKKSLETETVADLKQSLLQVMATNILSGRISEKAQNPEATFLGASISYGSLFDIKTAKALSLKVYPKPDKQKEAFTDVFTEIIRAVKFGYIQPEIDRAIAGITTAYENQIAKKDDRLHSQIEKAIQDNFLTNATMTDIEKEYDIAKQILNSITTEELHNTLKTLYTKNNRYFNVTGIEGKENLTEKDANKIITTLENDDTIQPYTEALSGKTLVSDLIIKEGKVVKTIPNKETGATTFVLSNGVKVRYKFVDKEKNGVVLKAISNGGLSLVNNEDLPSATLMGNLIMMSGLGDFSATDLKKVLAGKSASIRASLGEINESVSGSSNTKDVETMLQMVYVTFVKPRFDKQAFKVLQSSIEQSLIWKSKDIGSKISDSLMVTVFGKNNPKKRIFDQAYANEISFDRMKAVYKNRFADVSDFEFFIVGDVKAEQLKPLLEKYIASIPTKNITEKYNDNGAVWVSDKIKTDIYLKMENPKATVNVVYKKEMPYTIQNNIYTNALGDILQLRVLETVREAEGGAYSPNAAASFSREPKSQAIVSFNFDCNPDMVDRLVDIVNDELQKIANGTINDNDFNKIKTNFIKERQQAKDKNAYDMEWLTTYFRFNENINDSRNFESIVNSMSKNEIQNIAKQILTNCKSYQIIFKPEQ